MEGTARHSDRRRSSLVTDIINADKSIINQQRRQSITERKQSLASDVHITSPEQAAINARRMSYTPTNHEVRWSWTVIFGLSSEAKHGDLSYVSLSLLRGPIRLTYHAKTV